MAYPSTRRGEFHQHFRLPKEDPWEEGRFHDLRRPLRRDPGDQRLQLLSMAGGRSQEVDRERGTHACALHPCPFDERAGGGRGHPGLRRGHAHHRGVVRADPGHERDPPRPRRQTDQRSSGRPRHDYRLLRRSRRPQRLLAQVGGGVPSLLHRVRSPSGAEHELRDGTPGLLAAQARCGHAVQDFRVPRDRQPVLDTLDAHDGQALQQGGRHQPADRIQPFELGRQQDH